MGKQKVVVVGNCQARPIANMLAKMNKDLEVVKIAIVHLLSDKNKDEYIPFFEEADIIICQLVADNYPCEFVTTSFLTERYSEKIVKIVNLFSYRDTPYLRNLPKELRSQSAPLGDYHFPIVFDVWRKGGVIGDAVKLLKESVESSNSHTNKIGDLKDKENMADVLISDYIENSCDRVFHTFNHPVNTLLKEYCQRIVRYLGLEVDSDYSIFDVEFLGQIVPFEGGGSESLSKITVNNRAIYFSTEELVTKFFNFYEVNFDMSECKKAGAIPRVVVQYWDGSIPEDVGVLIESWKDFNPSFEHKIFNHSAAVDFILNNYGERAKSLFLKAKIPAMQSDIFRVAYCLVKGGIYIDCGSKAFSSIAPLIKEEKCLIVMRKWHGGVCNGFLATPPGNNIMKVIWEVILENLEAGVGNDVWSLTGPGLYNKYCENTESVKILDQEFLRKYFTLVNDLAHKKKNHWSVVQKDTSLFNDSGLIDKEVIVHIGQHKTGSTSIQRCAMQNRGKHFYYPDLGRLYSGHHDLPRLFLSLNETKFIEFCSSFIDEVKNNPSHKVLISSEFLSSTNELLFCESDMMKIWSRLAKLLSHFKESKIVYYIREQSLAIESRINQSVKSRICNHSLDYNLLIENKSLMYDFFYCKLQEVFKGSKIFPICYERKKFYKGDVCSDFFNRFFGVDLSYEESNPSIEDFDFFLACVKVNSLSIDVDTKMKIKGIIGKFIGGSSDKSAKTVLAKPDVDFILEYYREGNSKLAVDCDYFSGFSEFLKTERVSPVQDELFDDQMFFDLLIKAM